MDITLQVDYVIGNLYDAGKSYSGSDGRTACIWQERGLDLDFATNNTLRMKLTYDGQVFNLRRLNDNSHTWRQRNCKDSDYKYHI